MNGQIFELKIHQLLEQYSEEKKYMIFSEKYIRKINPEITRVDHCLYFKNKIICIQDKYSIHSLNAPDCESIYIHSKKLAKYLKTDLLYVILVSYTRCSNNIYKYKKVKNFINFHGETAINQLEEFIKKLTPDDLNNLYPHQQNTIEKYPCFGKYIVKHPVGTGKTITILGCISKFIKQNPNAHILWITKRLDIINSQFKYGNEYREFRFFPWLFHKTIICPSNIILNETNIIITNIDQIINKNLNKFDLIIIDEAHNAGAEKCFQFLINQDTNMLGFSATPFRNDNNIENLFISGILDEISFYDAVQAGIILAPKIHYVAVNAENKITFNDRFKTMYPKAIEVFRMSKTGWCIAWSSKIKYALIWYDALISEFNVMRNFGEFNEFELINSNKINILLCVGKCKEGFNEPIFDVSVSLDALKSSGNVSVQKLGRVARLYEGKTECHYLQGFEYKDKERVMETLAINLLGLYEYIEVSKKEPVYLSHGEFKIGKCIVDLQGILEEIKWNELENVMKEKLKITYRRLKKLVKIYNIKSVEEYENCKDLRFIKYPENLPKWEGWDKFLDVEFYSLSEMQNIIDKFKHINLIMTDKYEFIREQKKDSKIPSLRIAYDIYNFNELFNSLNEF